MTMCATGPSCGNTLPIHARRKYCDGCRGSMAYHAKKSPREILDTSKRYMKGLYRVEHLAERKMDLQEALSQKRRDKRTASAEAPKRVYRTKRKAANGGAARV
jgi:hypothetical protein